MRRVPFDPKQLTGDLRTWWDAWELKAVKATQELLTAHAAGQKGSGLPYRSDIWTELKKFLLEHVFHDKCAYCECHIPGRNFSADAEHYRPRNEVTALVNGKRAKIKVNGADHPGYFWLAYDWRNLVPSCEGCNSAAKRTLFPATTHSAAVPSNPDALDVLEKPLLLHPFRGPAPEDHWTYEKGGTVVSRTDEGDATIATLNLTRLDDERLAAQEIAEELMLARLAKKRPVASLWAEDVPFSRAVEAHLRRVREELLKELEGLAPAARAP